MQPCKHHTIAVIGLAQQGLVTTAEIPPLAQLFHQSRVYVDQTLINAIIDPKYTYGCVFLSLI
jgi:hypothetical protein